MDVAEPQRAKFLVYDGDSGAIRRLGSCSGADVELQAIDPGDVVMAEPSFEPSWALHYVVGGEIVERPTITLGAVPAGSTFRATCRETGQSHCGVVDDGMLVLDLPGTWDLAVKPPFPYRELTNVVVVPC